MRQIPGFNGAYSATEDGKIYSHLTDRYLKPKRHHNDYLAVTLVDPQGMRHDLLIHRLVCLTFHGYPKIWQTDVNHIDGNKANNTAGNLEWCTRKENMQHASKEGLLESVALAARKTCLAKSRPIAGYDQSGNLVCTFSSVNDARRAGYLKASDAASGNRKTAGGLTWKYI